MFVSLSITRKTFKFLTLFGAKAATTGEMRGGPRGVVLPKTHIATIVENSGKQGWIHLFFL